MRTVQLTSSRSIDLRVLVGEQHLNGEPKTAIVDVEAGRVDVSGRTLEEVAANALKAGWDMHERHARETVTVPALASAPLVWITPCLPPVLVEQNPLPEILADAGATLFDAPAPQKASAPRRPRR